MEKNFWITDQPLDIETVIAKVIRPEAGAVNLFTGTVREFTKGKRTLFLEYQAYKPMAEKKLAEIGREIEAKWGDAKTAIAHRIGRLDFSDRAVVIAVSTAHRTYDFAASRYAIDRIKEIVTIWKKEHWEGGLQWIGDQKERVSYEERIPTPQEIRGIKRLE